MAVGLLATTLRAMAAPAKADFDHDGRTDFTVFRPSTGEWYVRQSSTGFSTSSVTQWGLPGDVAVAGDYDGDGRIDYAVYRRSVPWSNPGQPSEWYILLSSTGYSTYAHVYFGLAADIPVPADYDGDGKTDIAVFRPSDGTWHVLRSSVSGSASYVIYPNITGAPFSSDYPVPADYDGDGKADLAVYRRTTGTWYFRWSSTGFLTTSSQTFGTYLDRPVPGDYDGDGKADLSLYRPSSGAWTVRPSGGGPVTTTSWGLLGDVPEPGDYDGVGKMEIAVYRPSNGFWYVLNWTTASQWGLAGDVPIANITQNDAIRRVNAFNDSIRASDFDGDGRADLTVFRPSSGTWYTLQSSTGFTGSTSVGWGIQGDVPEPGDYDGDGITDPVVWRPSEGNWYFRTLPKVFFEYSGTHNPWQFGLSTDTPYPIDLEGDGVSNLALLRPSGPFNPDWYLIYDGSYRSYFGTRAHSPAPGDIPVSADFDGDGRADLALYSPSSGTWIIALSTIRAEVMYQLGQPGDIPVPGDYDGDGAADVAVFRPSTGQWLIKLSSTGFATTQTFTFGVSGDTPVPGDFDGDGITDMAVWHPSTGVWSILQSATNFTQGVAYQWGQSGDIPILGRQ